MRTTKKATHARAFFNPQAEGAVSSGVVSLLKVSIPFPRYWFRECKSNGIG